jgi:hypothetical protein
MEVWYNGYSLNYKQLLYSAYILWQYNIQNVFGSHEFLSCKLTCNFVIWEVIVGFEEEENHLFLLLLHSAMKTYFGWCWTWEIWAHLWWKMICHYTSIIQLVFQKQLYLSSIVKKIFHLHLYLSIQKESFGQDTFRVFNRVNLSKNSVTFRATSIPNFWFLKIYF